MNISEANAVNVILRHAMGMPVTTVPSEDPMRSPDLMVLAAARLLASRANKALSAGITPDDIDEHWPGRAPATPAATEPPAGPARKPPVPSNPYADWPRIPVDDSDGSPFAQLMRFGVPAADMWTFGPDGPLQSPQPPAQAARGQIREALLHLLELGFLDIDNDRLAEVVAAPASRQSARPAEGASESQASR